MMAEADILTLGAGKTTTAGRFHPPTAQAKRILDPSTGEAEELGDVTMMGALGVTALPAVPTSDGEAEGLCFQGVGGSNTGYCFAAHDPRAADVVGEMGPGDTCLHGTHPDATNRARVFCKDGILALIVGNDLVMTLDRKSGAVSLAAFGNMIQVTSDGITLADSSGGAWMQVAGGACNIIGPTSIGNTAAQPLTTLAGIEAWVTTFGGLLTAIGTTPLTGATAAGVFANAASIAALTASGTLMLKGT